MIKIKYLVLKYKYKNQTGGFGNNLYQRLYKSMITTSEFDNFIRIHQDGFIGENNKMYAIQYDPKYSKYHSKMKKQQIMSMAIQTGNLQLVKYIDDKFGEEAYQQKYSIYL